MLFVALLIFIAIVAFMPERSGLRWALMGIYAAAAAVTFALILVTRKRAYGAGVSTAIGIMVVVLVLGSCLYFGYVGGPILILPTVVYYYGLSDSKLRRRLVAGVAIGGQVLLSIVVAAGFVAPTGMIPPELVMRTDHVLFAGMGTATLLAATYWLSSRSRHSTLLAMAELEQARRGIRQRDALLHEARDDLDRAVAGARVGRLTGRTIGGYRLEDVIGRGAVGEVYRANQDGQEVAVKVLHPHLAESPGQIQRFFREAQIIAALQSPHVPKLFASGTDDDGAPYLTLELLHGRDLAADLRDKKSLSLTEIDALVEQVCSALDAAHEAGVVHRDIKPQNLMHTTDAQWKVLDFGVAAIMSGSGTLTQGSAIGTPAYMAPEQALGAKVDRSADVFSVGAVIYRALTGRPAFAGTSSAATVYAAVHTQPVRPGELVEVPPDIDAVLALALAKDPRERLSSAGALAKAWQAARAGRLAGDLQRKAARLAAAHPWGTDRA